MNDRTTQPISETRLQTWPRQIFIDVQSSYDFAINYLRPTGIQRVETEIAKALVSRGHKAVVWDSECSGYREISVGHLTHSEARCVADDINALFKRPRDAAGIRAVDTALLRLGAVLTLIFPKLGSSRDRFLQSVIALFGRTAHALSIRERNVVARVLKLDRRVERQKYFLQATQNSSNGIVCSPLADFRSGDVLFLPTPLGYSQATKHYVKMAERGVHIVPLIYDLYPIRYPWATLNNDGDAKFKNALMLFLRICPLMLTISDWTARDFAAWCSENSLRKPNIITIPLAAGLRPIETVPPLMPSGFPFPDRPFVLMPGTFSATKNQAWAQILWSRLYEDLGSATWPLVFAGQRGYKQTETLERIKNDPAFGRLLYWVEAPSDTELAWLYCHCKFVITPAEFEGWGLGLSEALAFGKACLSSGRGALAEAGQGIVWECDPIDGRAWLTQCKEWMSDPEALAAAQVKVRKKYYLRTWAQVANDVISAINYSLTNYAIKN